MIKFSFKKYLTMIRLQLCSAIGRRKKEKLTVLAGSLVD